MSKSLLGKIFSIYSILLCLATIVVAIPWLFRVPSLIAPIVVVLISMIVLSGIALYRLYKKTENEGMFIKLIFGIYCFILMILLMSMILEREFMIFIWPILCVFIPIVIGYNYIWFKEKKE